MPRSIPEHKVQEIREATDILDLVSGYVTLKKKGQNFFGLCPFHQEKTPSFSVNPDKEIFHCFGCGVGGNAFTFIMQHEGVGFPESIRFLAQRAGIQIDYEERDESQGKQNEALYYVNEFAARKFSESIFEDSGKKTLAYLQNRGLSKHDIKTFGLGYAPPGWDNLLKAAEKESITGELLQEAGLVLRKEGGGIYDRFRDRIMFPIWNLSGRVVAFGGRILTDQKDSPKYINSPETSVYEKSKILYGLFQNRDEIRKQDQVIFVEGYMDVLGLLSNGVKHAVATSGTALTEEQARLIRRYTRNVILMYDSDSAGSAAALRGADILLQNSLEVFVAELPKGDDPDSFVREHGAEALLDHVHAAKNLFDFKLNYLSQKPPEKRGDDIRSLLDSLAKIKDRIQRSLLVTKVAEKLKMSENILWAELELVIRKARQTENWRSKIAQRLDDLSKVSKTSRLEKAVEDLIRILLRDWEMADFVFSSLDLPEDFESNKLAILNYLKNQYKGDNRVQTSELVHQFNDVELSSFLVQTLNEEFDSINFGRWAHDCINTIKRERIQRKLNHTREEMRKAQSSGQPVKEMLKACMELEEQKKLL